LEFYLIELERRLLCLRAITLSFSYVSLCGGTVTAKSSCYEDIWDTARNLDTNVNPNACGQGARKI